MESILEITDQATLLWGFTKQGILSPLMTPSSVALTLGVLIASLVIYRIFFHPLAHIPGPFLASFSGSWRQKRYWAGTWHDDVLELHRNYGRVVRIAPNEISIVDEDAMKLLYGHGHNAKKTTWYNTWRATIHAPAFFSEQDKKTHSFLRKRVSAAYTMTAILKVENYIQKCLDLMLVKLKNHADAGNSVDMAAWTNAFAFDVVGELSYGESLGQLATETDTMGVRKSIFSSFYYMANLGHYPGQIRLMNNVVFKTLSNILGKPNRMKDFNDWTRAKVRARLDGLANAEGREDMLSHFIKMKDANGNPASFDEVLVEAINIVGAGADTTSIGMRSCLYYLCRNPKAYVRLQKEIDDYYEKNELAKPITYNQTQQLEYLKAVVKESTRLLPSINYQLLRYAPDAGMTVDGKYIPGGTEVGISPIAQNRDKAIWGQDAEEFRPERWIEDEARARYLDTMTMTFGGNGPRMCVGRNIALVEMSKFLAQLLRNFDLEIVNKERPWHITTFWFSYQHDFNMYIRTRPNCLLASI